MNQSMRSDLVALGKGLATEFKCYKPCSRQQKCQLTDRGRELQVRFRQAP